MYHNRRWTVPSLWRYTATGRMKMTTSLIIPTKVFHMSRWRMQTAVFFLPVVFTATYWILISNNRPLKSSAWQARFCTKRTSPSKISSGNGTISNKLPVLTVPTSIIKCSTTYAAISTIRQYGRTVIRQPPESGQT